MQALMCPLTEQCEEDIELSGTIPLNVDQMYVAAHLSDFILIPYVQTLDA